MSPMRSNASTKPIGVNLTQKSPLTGRSHTMFLPTTAAKVREFLEHRNEVPLVQEMFPELNEEQREFLLSGCSPLDWQDMTQPELDS